MNANEKRLFAGLAVLTLVALCIFHVDYLGDYPLGLLLSRVVEALFISGGLTLVYVLHERCETAVNALKSGEAKDWRRDGNPSGWESLGHRKLD
jgi:hypothetical protein